MKILCSIRTLAQLVAWSACVGFFCGVLLAQLAA